MKKTLKIGFIVVSLFLLIDIGRYIFIPDVAELKKINPIPSSFMQYRMAQWKEEGLDKNITQKWVKLKQISPYVIKAVLISEDDKFWNHDGFDTKGLEDAFERNLKDGKFSAGGSTISQQLSKNLYLTPSKNPIRKIKEAILTYRIEHTLSKRRIIEIYLNVAEWGDGIFGIEAAARHYFHKSAKNLTAMEAAKLASVLPNPILYNPIGNQKTVLKKANRLYKIMQRRGIVIPEFVEIMKPETTDNNETLPDGNSSNDGRDDSLSNETIVEDTIHHSNENKDENGTIN
ncbi:MAG: monofunctional biosynthetic peptidoglycan transglycosylase [Epsilonproteobacteria bacterium]|nr:monofunctional biosynthetic peptidoglycan transglycosylase [Campylobacterota bacterium]